MKKELFFLVASVLTLQLHAQVLFNLQTSISVGSSPRGVVAADLNGDGWTDVAVVVGNNNALSVMTNDQHGSLVLAASPSIGGDPNPVVAADVNGDGKMDLVTASYGGNSVSILTNNGTAAFTLSSTVGVGQYPLIIATGDLNRDGKTDLVVPNSGASTISVLFNDGTGDFTNGGTYAVGYNPWNVCVADFNGDGESDVACINYGDSTLSVLTNTGSGKLAAAGTYSVGSNPRTLVAVDVNRDGKIDLVSANYYGNSITVLTNNGLGVFSVSGNYTVNNNPSWIAAADLNGDHLVDLAVANNGANTVTVLTNDGSGGFSISGTWTVGSNPWEVVAADINGDGKPDLITSDIGSGTISILTNGTIFPNFPPSITLQPTNVTVILGGSATFSVTATGNSPLYYQWNFNGTNMVNATNSTLILTNLQFAQAGSYWVTISNSYGSTSSVAAILTVNAPPPCDPGPSGTVAFWQGEGNANDSVGSNNGILKGTVGFASGEVGQAFNYTDTNSYVEITASPSLNVGLASGFTIEEWIKPANISSQMPLFGWGTNWPVNTNVLAGPILNTNNGHYYYLLQSDTWSNSQSIALQLGGNLAAIRNSGENLWVSNTFANYGNVQRNLWIGLYDPTHDAGGGHAGNFTWVDGEPVTFLDWANGEPNNCSGNEYWVMIYAPYPASASGTAGMWNDAYSTAPICNGTGNVTVYGVVELTNTPAGGGLYAGPAPYLWISLGLAGGLYGNMLDLANGAHIIESGAGMLQSNVYQHIAFTYNTNSGLASFYVNGTVVASTNIGSFVPNTSGDVYLGKRIDGVPTDTYAGSMDEVSLYSRALSATEIQAIYLAGSSGKCYTPVAPAIFSEPTNETAFANGSAVLTVGASGTPPLQYQWRFNGTNLMAATNSTLILSNLMVSQSGSYDVVVTNYAGSVTSTPAILTVLFIGIEVNSQIVTGTNTTLSPATITLLGGYPGGYLFYTLDGSAPSSSSTLYTGPFTLTNSAVIQTMALSSDFSQTSNGTPVTVIVVPTYPLQTSIVGSGTISTNPPGGIYASNTIVILTATPAAHWSFAHWSGDTNSTQNPLSVTMNGPHNFQAVFVQTAFPLTLTTPGGGTVTANGSPISPATYYPVGALVSIAATPNSGWVFTGWQGSVTGTNSPMTIVMNGTNIIQGIFGTMVPTNAAGGAIVLSQPNPVPYGTSLTLSAVPNPGDYLYNWTGIFYGTSLYQRLTVTSANPQVGALFASLPVGQFSLTIIANGPGYVSYSPPGSYFPSNTTMTLNAVPNAGNNFFGWSQGASGRGTLQFHLISNTVIQANFGVAPTVSISPSNQIVFAGSNATFTATEMGLPPLTNQWLNTLGTITGATNISLTISNVQPAGAGNYSVVVSSSVGSVTSSVAGLTIISTPVITNPPVPVSVTVGHPASYAVGVYGAPTLAYQWRQNGAAVAGATNAAFTISNSFPANAGVYTVAITNAYGSVTSTPVGLTVIPLNILLPVKQANGQFQVTFDTASGINYALQYSTNMIDWYPWLDLGGNGQPVTLVDPNTGGMPNRFYRVVLTPQ